MTTTYTTQLTENIKTFAEGFSAKAFALAAQAAIVATKDGAPQVKEAVNAAFDASSKVPGHLANTKSMLIKAGPALALKFDAILKAILAEEAGKTLDQLGGEFAAELTHHGLRNMANLAAFLKPAGAAGKSGKGSKTDTASTTGTTETAPNSKEMAKPLPLSAINSAVQDMNPPMDNELIEYKDALQQDAEAAEAEAARRIAAEAEAEAARQASNAAFLAAEQKRLTLAGESMERKAWAFAALAEELGIKLTKAQLKALDAFSLKKAA